jgi:DNA-binding SARP family transcriptional activator
VTGFVLTLLGAPILRTAEGHAVAVGIKPMALLTYLALESRPHSREVLAGLLWGESSEEEARASLRQVLKQLRDVAGGLLQADRSLVWLGTPIECDVLEFREAVLRDSGRAAAFDIPRFFEGVSVRHAPLYEEWLSSTRTTLLRQYHQVLARLVREAMGRRRWREAFDFADRWLASDPLSDEAALMAVEARYLSGNRAAALARFAEYRTTLAREAGCQPSRALLALVQRVECDREDPDRPITDEWYAHAPAFESRLIGREREWKVLSGAWKAARHGDGRIVLLEGESGVGKTRLAEESLRWILTNGGTVLRGRCYDGRAGMPYEPVVEALRGALAAPGLAATSPEWLLEAARVIPELRQRFPGLPMPAAADPGEAWRLFEGLAQLLTAIAGERPVVIAIDNLQWCDEDSSNLIRFLVRRLEHAPVLWLCLLTLGEVERDAPASRLSRVLRARAQAELLQLQPLSEEQLWEMVREMGHVSTPTGGRRFAARLFRITAGNPFYLIELLKTMFAQGLLSMDGATGEWTVSAAELGAGREVPMSRSVRDAIAERVERLPDELRDVLITIAVAAAGCRPDILSHVHGISRLHAAAIGDALVDRHLVVEQLGAYRCSHPVIAHLVRDALTASRRQEVNRMLALAMELVLQGGEVPIAVGELARHAERGGERGLAYRHALIAAERSMARFAYAEALDWLDLASSSARSAGESAAVGRLTAVVLEKAGWSEAPPAGPPLPVTREIASEDLDLRVSP